MPFKWVWSEEMKGGIIWSTCIHRENIITLWARYATKWSAFTVDYWIGGTLCITYTYTYICIAHLHLLLHEVCARPKPWKHLGHRNLLLSGDSHIPQPVLCLHLLKFHLDPLHLAPFLFNLGLHLGHLTFLQPHLIHHPLFLLILLRISFFYNCFSIFFEYPLQIMGHRVSVNSQSIFSPHVHCTSQFMITTGEGQGHKT